MSSRGKYNSTWDNKILTNLPGLHKDKLLFYKCKNSKTKGCDMLITTWNEKKKKGGMQKSLPVTFYQNTVSHLGHLQLTQSWAASRGDAPFPLSEGSVGRVTGNISSGTATGPQEPQCTTGMGVPQYRCLDINQSRSFELVRCPPTFCSLAFWVMESKACSLVRPENYTETT